MFAFLKRKTTAEAELVRICFESQSAMMQQCEEDLDRMVKTMRMEGRAAADLKRRAEIDFLAVCELSVRTACAMAKDMKTYGRFTALFGERLRTLVDSLGGDRNSMYLHFDETLRGLPEFMVTSEMTAKWKENQVNSRGIYLPSHLRT